jgi:hypothetical protein
MAASDNSEQALAYAERLLDNAYVQDNLASAAANLRSAYRRGSKRRVKPMRDAKIREQVRDAALSLNEAATALRTGRSKPEPRWGVRVLVLAGVGVIGAAVALAASDDLREKLFGGNEEAADRPPSVSDPSAAVASPLA